MDYNSRRNEAGINAEQSETAPDFRVTNESLGALAELTPADVEAGAIAMMARDHARMRLAGGNLAEAAIRVIHDYDGLHRLSLAVAGWAEAIASEGDRPHCTPAPSHKGGNRNGGQ